MALTNSQYDEIMRAYERDRHVRRQERLRRLEEVYRLVPGYRELDLRAPEAVATFGAEYVNGDRSALSALRERLHEASEEKRKLLTDNGYAADYLEPAYTCADCQDTGYVDGARCKCFEQKIRDLLYRQSNLHTLIQTNNFARMSDAYYEGEDLRRFNAAVESCYDFVEGFGKEDGYRNLFFFGPVGSGKSFLSIATAAKILEMGKSVLYFSSIDLVDRLSDDVFSDRQETARGRLRADLTSCDLLIVDDLGTELTNAFVSTQLFYLINERHLKQKATIISTNLELDELRARYSDRVFSRLMSFYTVVELTGADIRLLQKTTA